MNIVDSGSDLMDGTDKTVATTETHGTLLFRVDTSPLQDGDILDIWTEAEIADSGNMYPVTRKITIEGTAIAGKQIVDVQPFVNAHTFECHLEQTAGTNRTITWELIRV